MLWRTTRSLTSVLHAYLQIVSILNGDAGRAEIFYQIFTTSTTSITKNINNYHLSVTY